jgi:hypothetical protein
MYKILNVLFFIALILCSTTINAQSEVEKLNKYFSTQEQLSNFSKDYSYEAKFSKLGGLFKIAYPAENIALNNYFSVSFDGNNLSIKPTHKNGAGGTYQLSQIAPNVYSVNGQIGTVIVFDNYGIFHFKVTEDAASKLGFKAVANAYDRQHQFYGGAKKFPEQVGSTTSFEWEAGAWGNNPISYSSSEQEKTIANQINTIAEKHKVVLKSFAKNGDKMANEKKAKEANEKQQEIDALIAEFAPPSIFEEEVAKWNKKGKARIIALRVNKEFNAKNHESMKKWDGKLTGADIYGVGEMEFVGNGPEATIGLSKSEDGTYYDLKCKGLTNADWTTVSNFAKYEKSYYYEFDGYKQVKLHDEPVAPWFWIEGNLVELISSSVWNNTLNYYIIYAFPGAKKLKIEDRLLFSRLKQYMLKVVNPAQKKVPLKK